MTFKNGLMALAAFVMTGTSYGIDCADYVNQAVALNKAQQVLRCGYAGADWSSDRMYHYDWCVAAHGDMNYVLQHLNEKKKQVRTCLGVEVGMGNCAAYASRAVWQNQAAAVLSCSFANSGGRWLNDYAAHENWCHAASNMAYADGEDRARRLQLVACIR